MPQTFTRQRLNFEEFEIGQVCMSAGRTVTEADIVNFAGFTGDYTQLHTNAQHAELGPFGQSIAHGVLGMAIASGLLVQLGIMENTIRAFGELTWKFSRPVFVGDTTRAEGTVTGLKPMPRAGGGLFTLAVKVINQDGQVVQRGRWVALVAGTPAEPPLA